MDIAHSYYDGLLKKCEEGPSGMTCKNNEGESVKWFFGQRSKDKFHLWNEDRWDMAGIPMTSDTHALYRTTSKCFAFKNPSERSCFSIQDQIGLKYHELQTTKQENQRQTEDEKRKLEESRPVNDCQPGKDKTTVAPKEKDSPKNLYCSGKRSVRWSRLAYSTSCVHSKHGFFRDPVCINGLNHSKRHAKNGGLEECFPDKNTQQKPQMPLCLCTSFRVERKTRYKTKV
ncbi:hypothetical protein L596_017735 [Steinernema carpocapsae]|uniref:Uncharacterized protein n=1 Tax=Steinernema carpocapsae TaxID=34508 RepID=A0A4U5N2S4_STECR|nr:hypothetical protein L596_017735 [Steinernema carpocapsae]